MVDKKSKILFLVFGLLLVGSVAVTYWRIVVARDYVIESQLDCDIATESCFVWECDPSVEECTGDPAEDMWYYKIARRNAQNIPLCDPAQDETCEPFACPEGEEECEIILCEASEETPCIGPGVVMEEEEEGTEEVEGADESEAMGDGEDVVEEQEDSPTSSEDSSTEE